MKVKARIEIEVPGDTKATDFAVILQQVKDTLDRVGYKCKVVDIVSSDK